jgi:phosphoribosylformylglycinamidine (FGAM) synthase PurS component
VHETANSTGQVWRLEIGAKQGMPDALAAATRSRLQSIDVSPVDLATRRVYLLELSDGQPGEAAQVLAALVDPVTEVGAVGVLPDPPGDTLVLTVGFRPGVTDAVGRTVLRAAADRLGRALDGDVYTATMYVFRGLTRAEVERAARELHNPLIQRVRIDAPPRTPDVDPAARRQHAGARGRVGPAARGRRRAPAAHLAVGPAGAVAGGDAGDPAAFPIWGATRPTRSSSVWRRRGASTASTRSSRRRSLHRPAGHTGRSSAACLKSTSAGPPRRSRRRGAASTTQPFLVSVFHDNAGVVRFTDADHLVYKVETHNSPSALDPYGGAMTGIVGVNRDSLGPGSAPTC